MSKHSRTSGWLTSLVFLLLPLIYGCTMKEAAPNSSLVISEHARRLVYEKFPNARNLTGAVIEKGKVFEFSFNVDDERYSAIVNNSEIISTARTNGEEVPDSLVNRLQNATIKGGAISDYRTITLFDGYVSNPAVNYRLNGMDFVASFGVSSIYMSPYPRWYYIKNINDLPDPIIDFIQKRSKPNPAFVNTLTNFNEETRKSIAQNNEFEFGGATVYTNLDGTKTYDVAVRYLGTDSQNLLFDKDYNLIWVGSFNQIRQYNEDFSGRNFDTNLTRKEISTFTDIFGAPSHFLNFGLDVGYNLMRSYRNEYEGVTSYIFWLDNGRGEQWMLRYNADKKIVFSSYSKP
ncbi:MAG: hypothetical protein J7619_26660 [Dyadobacter sp.]|uniref:hypothetical protein n=1 Tax=Dyadobacter sp. TaxID=1914288 RepID=UPI001B1B5795|nr:hypothetical protein [Dyadobacter sp.]MBO9616305.1 hypothetical protein [Dyadobacter sp.]